MSKYKSIGFSILALLAILLVVVGIKGSQIFAMVEAGNSFVAPPESVSTFTAERQSWPNVYTAIGTIEADEGIIIAAEVAGKVQRIAFKSGERVEAGEVLLEQESGNERAQLNAAKARLQLSKTSHERLQQLREKNTVSQSELDAALQQMDSAQGDVDDLSATLAKKLVRAPFAGRLGIRQVDLGQDLQVGSAIVSLQATNRVRVNFPVPQHWLAPMRNGLGVDVKVGDGSNQVLQGVITAIGAEINPTTRNAMVQSSLDNSKGLLIPGMAVETQVTLTDPQDVLVVPATAIVYAPFGDTVFVVEKNPEGQLKARQQFIRLGKARGDFVEIVDGLKEGDVVASSGAFKLTNGQSIVVSDIASPEYQLEPTPVDS